MRLYLDTSALRLAEVERDLKLRRTPAGATQLFACRLLQVEAASAVRRLKREHPRRQLSLQSAEEGIAATLASCLVAELGDNVLARAQLDFPLEPVRSLDAIHLAAALWWRDQLSVTGDALIFASTDDLLRANAAALCFPLIPLLIERSCVLPHPPDSQHAPRSLRETRASRNPAAIPKGRGGSEPARRVHQKTR